MYVTPLGGDGKNKVHRFNMFGKNTGCVENPYFYVVNIYYLDLT